MTATPDASPAPTKHRQDVEVQAVANVRHQSVSTSPGLFSHPSQPPRIPMGPQVEEAEKLTMVYQVEATGKHTLLSTETHLASATAPAPISSSSTQAPQSGGVVHTDSAPQQQCESRLGAKPKESGAGPPSCNSQTVPLVPLQPVYQINIEPCTQNTTQAGCHPTVAGPTAAEQSTGLAEQQKALSEKKKPAAAKEVHLAMSATESVPAAQCAKPPADKPPSVSVSVSVPPPAASAAKAGRKESGAAAAMSVSVASTTSTIVKEQKRGSAFTTTTTATATTTTTAAGKKKTPSEPKLEPDREAEDKLSKSVHDVVWDEQGMTWEVYGASLDPESLGFAIQSHLQCKIKEHEKKIVAQTSIRKSVSSPESPAGRKKKGKRRQANVFRSMFQNVRRPNCCVRPPPSSVLD